MAGSTINEPVAERNTGARRPSFWYTRFGHHCRPLIPELQSLGRGSIAQIRSDRAGRRAGGRFYEICAVRRGGDECRIAGHPYRIGPGELFMAAPEHEISRASPRSAAGQVYWLSLDLGSGEGSLDSSIAAALDRHALRVIAAPGRLPALFDRLLAEHQNADEHSTWAARGALHCLLAEILRAYETAPSANGRTPPSEAIAAAIAIIEDRLAEKLPITRLAAAVQLSPGRFHDRFLLETGYTPADYWSRRRVATALELLADSTLSITEIAHTLGFSTSQYFATFFRRFTGMSPRDHRRQFQLP
jgi:AraC family L-rhamnose operon regulatory protein RhaS